MTKNAIPAVLSAALTITLVSPALGADNPAGVSDRGVKLLQKAGSATYAILLNRGGKVAEVPDDYEFRSGDQFTIKVNLSQGAGYVYVINRTLSGEAVSSNTTLRSMPNLSEQGMLQNASSSTPGFTVVYPAKGHQLHQRGTVTIPPRDSFEMDSVPGIEKLYVVVSPNPLNDFRGMLDRANGPIPRQNTPAPSGNTQIAGQQTKPSEQEILTAMRGMALNAEVEPPPTSSRAVLLVSAVAVPYRPASTPAAPRPQPPASTSVAKPNQGVVAPLVKTKPFLIELTLMHK